jgi:hypothetical protein
MSETRLLNVALTYARARHAYRKAVVQAIAGDDDDVARRDLAYNAMEFAADVLERAGLEYDAQHSLPALDTATPRPWQPSEGSAA